MIGTTLVVQRCTTSVGRRRDSASTTRCRSTNDYDEFPCAPVDRADVSPARDRRTTGSCPTCRHATGATSTWTGMMASRSTIPDHGAGSVVQVGATRSPRSRPSRPDAIVDHDGTRTKPSGNVVEQDRVARSGSAGRARWPEEHRRRPTTAIGVASFGLERRASSQTARSGRRRFRRRRCARPMRLGTTRSVAPHSPTSCAAAVTTSTATEPCQYGHPQRRCAPRQSAARSQQPHEQQVRQGRAAAGSGRRRWIVTSRSPRRGSNSAA